MQISYQFSSSDFPITWTHIALTFDNVSGLYTFGNNEKTHILTFIVSIFFDDRKEFTLEYLVQAEKEQSLAKGYFQGINMTVVVILNCQQNLYLSKNIP